MNPSKAPYVVQRQETDQGDWRPIASCNTLDYAELIALFGLRRHTGALYRVTDSRTGAQTALLPGAMATAA
jgi:hypothetical protein